MRKFGTHLIALFILGTCFAYSGCGSSISAEDSAKLKELEALPRVAFDSYGTHFSLAKIDGLKSVHRDSVPWGYMMPQTPENGQVMYYFFPGYALELASPQIRIEYMAKSLKGCGSIDSILTWLKSIYIGTERQGLVVSEGPVRTLGGEDLTLLEIAIQPFKRDSVNLTGKTMAWAYADQGDMILGLTYSAVQPDDYKQGFQQFKDLVMSYKNEGSSGIEAPKEAPATKEPSDPKVAVPAGEQPQKTPRNVAVPAVPAGKDGK